VRRPRLLLVGRTRYRVPLDEASVRKLSLLETGLEVRVLASAADGRAYDDGRVRLLPAARPRPLDGLAFHLLLPARLAGELRRTDADAVSAENHAIGAAALLARRLAGSRAKVLVDVHGDWRGGMRLYGSPLRRLLGPVDDRLARWTLRRADAVRVISPYTAELVRALGVEPGAVLPGYTDPGPFRATPTRPLPQRPQALFVGSLEPTKGVDVLVRAWRDVAARVPEARLRVLGTGSLAGLVRELVVELPDGVSWTPRVPPEEVAAALDASTLLVLPSRSEGLGRVVLEAFLRRRPVVGSAVGGIADLVADGVTGVLVPPGDAHSLAGAVVRVLSDRELAERLAARTEAAARPTLEALDEFGDRFAAFVRAAVGPTLAP
jgi:glycosyltransferase involved in cell wall biosynthesis